jgi:hypothetical protein
MSTTAVFGSGFPPHPASVSAHAVAAAYRMQQQLRLDIRDLAKDGRV